ncbi:MAG: PAS domain S-box protein [Bacteroidia bacterium]
MNDLNNKLRILHLEDLPDDAALVERELKKGNIQFEKLVVDTRSDFKKALKEFSPDLILCDHSLSSFDSIEALKIMMQSGNKIPFILVTGTVSEEFAVDIIKKGADDYILKDRLERLPTAIRNILGKYRLEKERAQMINEQAHLATIVNSSNDGIISKTLDGTITSWNLSAEALFGYSAIEAIGKNISMLFPQDRLNEEAEVMERITKGEHIQHFETVRLTKDGTALDVSLTISPLKDAIGNTTGAAKIVHDISDRKSAEKKITNANRLYNFISQINKTIVQTGDGQAVYKEACRIAIEIGMFKAAWIGHIDLPKQRINLIAEAGMPDEDKELLNGSYIGKIGPQYHAWSTGAYYVCNDIQQDLKLNNWKEFALARGYGSVMVLPIKKSGRIIGVFNLYAEEINFFNSQEIKLLGEATDDISFALDVFEKDKRRTDAEKKLINKQSRLNHAQAIAHLGSWEFDFLTGLATWSDEACRIYGLSPVNNLQSYKSWVSFIHPDDLEYVMRVTREAEVTLSNLDFIHRIVRKDGIIRHVHTQLQYQFNTEAKPVGIYGVEHDVTEMMEAEESLRKSESNLKAIIENTDATIYSLDRDFRYITFNQLLHNSMKQIYGLDIKPGDKVYDFLEKLNPEEAREWKEVYSKALNGEIVKFEKEFSIGDYYSCYTFSIYPIWENENVIGLSCFALDITKQKQSANLFRQSELRYRQIVETAQEGIWLIDENSKTTFANKKMCEILEYTEQEMLGKENFYFMDEAGRKEGSIALERRKNGIGEIMELRYITKSGKHIWTNVSANPVFDDDGNYKGALAMVSDITEKKNLEKAFEYERERFHDLFLTAPSCIAILKGPNHIFEIANELYLKLINKKDIIGKSVKEVLPEVAGQGFIELLNKVYLTGETFSANEMLVKLDTEVNGELIDKYLNFIYQAYRNAAGIIEGIFVFVVDVTEQVQSRKKIEKSEKQYKQIVETAQEGIWLIDENNITTFVNKKMCDILEYAEDQMLGKENYYFMEDASKEHALKSVEKRKKGIGENYEIRLITKSGKHLCTNVSANPVFDEDGNYKGALGMISDITEKKTLEELLEKSNRLARIGSWEIDVTKGSVFWSPVTKEIREADPDFIPDLSTGIRFFKEGTHRETISHRVQQCIENGTSWDEELQIVTQKGNLKWIRTIGEGEFIKGKCVRVFGSFQDINARKISETEVLKAYEDKNIILESIGDGFYALDKNWQITYWNKEAEILLGKKREDVIGKNIWEIYPETVDTITYINYHKAVDEKTVQHYVRFNESLNRWAEISAYPSSNGLSVYFQDITARKLSEIRLKELNENLQAHTNELLISNKEMEQFSYIVSHNLRAPVANIISFAEELKDENYTPEEQKSFVNLLSTSVLKLDDVIKDLNHILKVKRDVTEPRESVYFSDLVEDIKISIASLLVKEKVIISTDFSEVDELVCLKGYLYSVFYNLITNSIKYHQPGISAIINIQSKKSGDKIILSFKDNGSGIDLKVKGDQVFGLYKRFHQHIEGKGMSLFMTKTQIGIIGGTIEIKSEVNKGTEFIITLPA